MKEKFLKLFNLLGIEAKFADASSPTEAELGAALDAAAAAATDLKQRAEAQSKASVSEKAIRALMTESGGALSYEGAKQVIADRADHAAKQKKK